MKTRVLVVDGDVARRLRAVAALSAEFEAIPVADGEDPLRAARNGRAEMALVALPRRRPRSAAHLCRMLRTDLRPVRRIAIYGRGDVPPDEALDQWQADAFAAEDLDGDALLAFVRAAWRGERIARAGEPPPSGPLRRLLRRVVP